MRRIVVIGGTSSIAEHCLRLWLHEPCYITLVGRNESKLQEVAEDLAVRSADSVVKYLVADLSNVDAIEELACKMSEKPLDIVLVAHGNLSDQKACQADLSFCQEEMQINGISPALFAEAFARQMERHNYGTLIVISSVAGDRGRKSNYVYGAAKGLLTRYVQGLQHRLAETAIKVVLVKPGPTDTPMTAHLTESNTKLAKVDEVAKTIVYGAARGNAVIYSPKVWWVIMMVIRHLPRKMFNKINI